jgi:hypothetical protein
MSEENDYPVELEKVHIKEWKKDIYIRPISFEEQLQWEKSIDKENVGNSIPLLISLSVCDKDGNLLWDSAKVSKFPAKIVQRLQLICSKVSGLRQKDFDELLKNSDADQPA